MERLANTSRTASHLESIPQKNSKTGVTGATRKTEKHLPGVNLDKLRATARSAQALAKLDFFSPMFTIRKHGQNQDIYISMSRSTRKRVKDTYFVSDHATRQQLEICLNHTDEQANIDSSHLHSRTLTVYELAGLDFFTWSSFGDKALAAKKCAATFGLQIRRS